LRATTASQSSAELLICVTAAVLMEALYVSSFGCRYPDFDAKSSFTTETLRHGERQEIACFFDVLASLRR
jgi:hypothetical protein